MASTGDMNVDNFEKFKQMLETFSEKVIAGDQQSIGILVAVFVVILSLFIFVFGRGKTKKNACLFVGLCDSGKTLMFTRLVYGKFKVTQTSMKENIGISLPFDDGKKKVLKIVDLPGHERSRQKFFDSFKDQGRALIFVVDSTTVQKEIKDVAECLYNVLCDNTILKNSIPILVACNKQDNHMVKGCKVIQKQLEKEMNLVRQFRAGQLDSIAGSSNNNTFIGKKNKDFEFADLKPLKVDFAECFARGNDEDEHDLKSVYEWLNTVS